MSLSPFFKIIKKKVFQFLKKKKYFNFFQKSISKYLTTRRYYFPTLKDGYIGSANVIFDGKLEVSNSISRRILCLPVYVNCTNETRSKIQEVVKKSLEGVA